MWIHLPVSFLHSELRQCLPLIWLCLYQSSITFQTQNFLALIPTSVIPFCMMFQKWHHSWDYHRTQRLPPKQNLKFPWQVNSRYVTFPWTLLPVFTHCLLLFFCRLLCFVLPLEVIGNVVKWLKTWALESERQKWILQITDTQILRMLSYLSERDFIACKVGMTMLLHLENCWDSYLRQRIYKTYILLDSTWPLGGFIVIVSSCYRNFARLPPFFHSYPLPPTHPLIWPYVHTQTRSFLTSVSVPFQYLLN